VSFFRKKPIFMHKNMIFCAQLVFGYSLGVGAELFSFETTPSTVLLSLRDLRKQIVAISKGLFLSYLDKQIKLSACNRHGLTSSR